MADLLHLAESASARKGHMSYIAAVFIRKVNHNLASKDICEQTANCLILLVHLLAASNKDVASNTSVRGNIASRRGLLRMFLGSRAALAALKSATG